MDSDFDIRYTDRPITPFTKLKVKYHTVDIDSTVITRYGNQEGVEVGYNPRKPGRGSQHPLIALLLKPEWLSSRGCAQAIVQVVQTSKIS